MKKLVVLYKLPADSDAFMRHYCKEHLPLVAKIPGLVKTEVTRINKTLMGEKGNFLLAELYFADEATFKVAMSSPENAATGADLAKFANGLATIMIGEVL